MPRPAAAYTAQPYVPTAESVLGGHKRSPGETLITIPAGKTWIGELVLSCTVLVAPNGGPVSANARITLVGSGVTPDEGDILRIELSGAASSGLLNNGTAANETIALPITIIAAAGNEVAVVLNADWMTAVAASAMGILF
jgi:hypothetical protein